MKAALLQMNSGDDPVANAKAIVRAVSQAADLGADFLLTPEVSNCVSSSRAHQRSVLALEEDDKTLAAVRKAARDHGMWVLLGSLALRSGDADERFANRSFLIDASGEIRARYDKIHMFDVTLSETESYRESDGYRPGDTAIVADTPWGKIGMTICYDLRFPHLFRALAQAGAQIVAVPSAFSVPTGEAHWYTLLRARAIETGCFVLAPAQTGSHAAHQGRPRRTFGHSLAVDPWGAVLLDAGTEASLTLVELPLSDVERARGRVPSLSHDRPFKGPAT